MSRAVDLATMPLFVRAGAILPLGPVRQHTGDVIDRPVSVQVYPGDDGLFTLYEDDGLTFDYRRGNWMGIEMRWTDAMRRLTLRLANGSKMLSPASRRLSIRLVGTQTTRTVDFSGAPTAVRF